MCQNCLTAHQIIQVNKELLFQPTYHYRASLTKDVIQGMNDLVNNLSYLFNDPSKKMQIQAMPFAGDHRLGDAIAGYRDSQQDHRSLLRRSTQLRVAL